MTFDSISCALTYPRLHIIYRNEETVHFAIFHLSSNLAGFHCLHILMLRQNFNLIFCKISESRVYIAFGRSLLPLIVQQPCNGSSQTHQKRCSQHYCNGCQYSSAAVIPEPAGGKCFNHTISPPCRLQSRWFCLPSEQYLHYELSPPESARIFSQKASEAP